jgi:N-carbamoylputrescine amidase
MFNTRKYAVGLVQMRMGPDPEANFAAAVRHIEEAARLGANIVCLPELFRAQYFCQREDTKLFDLAEPIPGPSTEKLAEVARNNRVAIVASLFERRAPGLYHNTAVTLNSDGAIAGVYRKMHIPDDPLYYEKYYFAPGDLGFQAVDTAFGRVGTLVCWDQWYPEAARLTALQGAEVLFYPTAIGWHPAEKDEFGAAQHEAWQTIQRAHAIANGVYVAGVNRVGLEHGDVNGNRATGPGIEFWGGSFLADPFGRIIAKASHDAEEILLGEIDLGLIEDTRRNWPFLRDRRIDAYAVFLKKDSSLSVIEVEDNSRLLYIGKSESSIEVRKHCSYPNSSASTLRRSLGAILKQDPKQELKLSAFPCGFKRNAGPKDIQNYRFDEKGEKELSEWMNKNLEFSYLLLGRDIRSSERQRIQKFNPPLNLTLSKNKNRDKLDKLRKICRDEASQWTNIKE